MYSETKGSILIEFSRFVRRQMPHNLPETRSGLARAIAAAVSGLHMGGPREVDLSLRSQGGRYEEVNGRSYRIEIDGSYGYDRVQPFMRITVGIPVHRFPVVVSDPDRQANNGCMPVGAINISQADYNAKQENKDPVAVVLAAAEFLFKLTALSFDKAWARDEAGRVKDAYDAFLAAGTDDVTYLVEAIKLRTQSVIVADKPGVRSCAKYIIGPRAAGVLIPWECSASARLVVETYISALELAAKHNEASGTAPVLPLLHSAVTVESCGVHV